MKWLAALLVLLLISALALACDGEEEAATARPSPAATVTATPHATPTTSFPETVAGTFDDAFSYCAAVDTVDEVVRLDMSAGNVKEWHWITVDNRWSGPPVPEPVRESLGLRPVTPLPGTEHVADRGLSWRCFEGKVWGCSVGANLVCGKAETGRDPNRQMVEFCRENPQYDDLPFGVTGHGTIYIWYCRDGTPVIDRESLHVDPRGFISQNWYEIQP
jgi:hypothetical protein